MAYFDSNAAYALDYQAQPNYAPDYERAPLERPSERPRFDVLTGAGREANQIVSPAFTHVVKVFAVLVFLFVSIGVVRVTLASVTTSMLNQNAELSASLEAAHDESSNLEVMKTVYGADTRIRDLATGTLGMVEPEQGITLDLSETADAEDGADATAEGQQAPADTATETAE